MLLETPVPNQLPIYTPLELIIAIIRLFPCNPTDPSGTPSAMAECNDAGAGNLPKYISERSTKLSSVTALNDFEASPVTAMRKVNNEVAADAPKAKRCDATKVAV